MLIKPRNEILQEPLGEFYYSEYINYGRMASVKPEEAVEPVVAEREPLSERIKWKLKNYFRDEDGLGRYLGRVKGSYRHDKELMDENAGKLGDRYFIASLVIWGFYGIKVIIYTLAWLSHPLTMFSSGSHNKSCNYNEYLSVACPQQIAIPVEKTPNTDLKLNGSYKGSAYYGTSDIYAINRDKIREASYILRRAIYKGSNNLNCLLVKSSYRKVGSEELLEAQALGEFSEPFLTQYITFGDKINNAIKVMLGSRIKMITKKEKTYLVVHNGNIPTLAEEIGKMFNEPVKIKVTSNE